MLLVCERKDFLSSYCSTISIIGVVAYRYPSLVGFSFGLWFFLPPTPSRSPAIDAEIPDWLRRAVPSKSHSYTN